MRHVVPVFALVSLLELGATLSEVKANHLYVHSPYDLEQNQVALTYWLDGFLNSPISTLGPVPRKDLLLHTASVAYGISDRWSLEGFVDFVEPTREGTEQFTLAQYRVHTIYRLLDRQEYWPAVGLLAEYDLPQRRFFHSDRRELQLLLESRGDQWMVRVNPDVITDSGSAKFDYDFGLYWFLQPTVRVGAESFPSFVQVRSFTKNSGRHTWGPAVRFEWGRVGWDVGVQFGWTEHTDYVVFKSIVEFTF